MYLDLIHEPPKIKSIPYRFPKLISDWENKTNIQQIHIYIHTYACHPEVDTRWRTKDILRNTGESYSIYSRMILYIYIYVHLCVYCSSSIFQNAQEIVLLNRGPKQGWKIRHVQNATAVFV